MQMSESCLDDANYNKMIQTMNFNDLLMMSLDDSDEEDDENTCLISGEKLDETCIKLKCKHSFNYKYLFNELKHQKMYNGLEITHLSKRQIKCPYCRTIQNGLIPWKEGFAKVNGVNGPPSLYYKGNKWKQSINARVIGIE